MTTLHAARRVLQTPAITATIYPTFACAHQFVGRYDKERARAVHPAAASTPWGLDQNRQNSSIAAPNARHPYMEIFKYPYRRFLSSSSVPRIFLQELFTSGYRTGFLSGVDSGRFSPGESGIMNLVT